MEKGNCDLCLILSPSFFHCRYERHTRAGAVHVNDYWQTFLAGLQYLVEYGKPRIEGHFIKNFGLKYDSNRLF